MATLTVTLRPTVSSGLALMLAGGAQVFKCKFDKQAAKPIKAERERGGVGGTG